MGRDATKAAGNPWFEARKKASEYDYIVVNDDIDNAVEKFSGIIDAERLKTIRNKKIISEVINNV